MYAYVCVEERMRRRERERESELSSSHDRTLADTWGSVPHYYGFETAGGFEEARHNAQGADWRDQVMLLPETPNPKP